MDKFREIKLPTGESITVEFNHDFLDRIKSQFDLSKAEEVSDDHIRMFIYGSIKGGVDRARSLGTVEIVDNTFPELKSK